MRLIFKLGLLVLIQQTVMVAVMASAINQQSGIIKSSIYQQSESLVNQFQQRSITSKQPPHGKRKSFLQELSSGAGLYIALSIAFVVLLGLLLWGFVKVIVPASTPSSSSSLSEKGSKASSHSVTKMDLDLDPKKDYSTKGILKKPSAQGLKPLVDLQGVHIPQSAGIAKLKKQVRIGNVHNDDDEEDEEEDDDDDGRQKYHQRKIGRSKRPSKRASSQVPRSSSSSEGSKTSGPAKHMKLIDFAGNNGNSINNKIIDFAHNNHNLRNKKQESNNPTIPPGAPLLYSFNLPPSIIPALSLPPPALFPPPPPPPPMLNPMLSAATTHSQQPTPLSSSSLSHQQFNLGIPTLAFPPIQMPGNPALGMGMIPTPSYYREEKEK